MTARPYRLISPAPRWTLAGNIANLARVLLALIWTVAWGSWDWLRETTEYMAAWENDGKPRWLPKWRWHFMWSRHSSPKAVWCEGCGWAGPLRWAVHEYCGDEAVDECPRCGRDALAPVWRGRRGWCS